MNKQRDEVLQRIGWALGTLRSACSTVSIGENIVGCERPVAEAKEMARKQIAKLRENLDSLEETL